ncbi:VOC family protein [Bacillus niameyensis]|uniref:VOC family protein n=1 Tax=Bacillus niameyensis TaxID=1522308 RepID=UPI000782DA8D|nr:VOC family protein [Bacillus niameyensis]
MKNQPIVDQVVLNVRDLELTLDFYTKVLGFKVIKHSDKKAVLSANGAAGLLILEKEEGSIPRPPRTTGLYHIAFLLPSRPDLANFVQYLIDFQYPIQGASDHSVSEALYLADPEGNGIEIYTDRDSQLWKWNKDEVHMTTEALDIRDLLEEKTEIGWKGIPVDTVIGHIHLQVSDLKKTEQFYCEGLGFDVVARYGPQALFVSKDRYHHHIGLNTWNSLNGMVPPENSTGLKWYSITLSSNEDYVKVKEQLSEIHADAQEKDEMLFVKDPSGISIRIQFN